MMKNYIELDIDYESIIYEDEIEEENEEYWEEEEE